MSPPLIQFQNVTKQFHAVTALDSVSFDVHRGDLHALCGENGAGKSTLMKILSGVITEFEGQITVGGRRLAISGTREAEAMGISIIHQELNLVSDLSVAANIFLGRELQTPLGLLDDRTMAQRAAMIFSQLDCDIDPNASVRSLRIGDQQLVEIAKALSLESSLLGVVDGQPAPSSTNAGDDQNSEAGSSRILIMDEPTSALTESEVDRLFRIIQRLRQQKVTIVYISHKMDEIFRLADQITILRDGRVAKTLPKSETTPREVTHLMVGREIGTSEFGIDRSIGPVILRVDKLSLAWPDHVRQWRLKHIDLEVRQGEVLGIAGLMGAGRTELLECLFGASSQAPTGHIEFEGRPVQFAHPAQAIQAGIGLVTEDRKRFGLFTEMTVRDHITLSSLPEFATWMMISRSKESRAADDSIATLGVKSVGREAAITSLSGGNQQKCIIARSLMTRPKVLLLDDPTRGIDVGAKAEIYRLIDQFCRQGLAIIITSSELPELITVCDRIMVLCEGRATAEFRRGEFSEQKLMEAATVF